MLIEALFTIYKWIKMWCVCVYIYMIEYYIYERIL